MKNICLCAHLKFISYNSLQKTRKIYEFHSYYAALQAYHHRRRSHKAISDSSMNYSSKPGAIIIQIPVNE